MSNTKKEDSQVNAETKRFNTRKLKYGSLATAITVIFIVAVVLVNILATQVTKRFGMKIDVTKEQIFEISQQTRDYLDTLEEDIDISVMVDEYALENGGIYYKLVKEVTEKYASCSDKINLNYYDPEKNPEVVAKYKQFYAKSIGAEDIVINCGERIRVLKMGDLYETRMDEYYRQEIKAIKADQELTSAVMYVANPSPPVIGIISCKSSDSVTVSLSQLQSILEKNGYTVETVDLLTQDADPKYSMLILPAPYNDLTPDVMGKLDNYLYNNGNLGKNLFYIANCDQRETPNIDAFLEEWGIKAEIGYVMNVDSKSSMAPPIAGLQSRYETGKLNIAVDEYKDLVTDNTLPIVSPFARPLTLLFDQKDDRETKAILQTLETTIVNDGTISDKKLEELTQSVQNVLVLGSKHIYKDSNQISSNLIVSGSAYMLDYALTSDASFNNQEFTVNLLNKFTEKEGIVILSKSLDIESINITEAQSRRVIWVTVIILPLVVIITGLVVFIRRRNR